MLRHLDAAAVAPVRRHRRHPGRAVALTLALAVVAVAAACSADTTGVGGVAAPVADAPEHKVTVAGDSISVGLGAALRGAVDPETVVKVIGVEGTGLARPDTFDWPARLAELARDFPPQVLVLSLGSNDASDLVDADGTLVAALSDTEAWDAEYTRRLAESFDAFEGTDTTAVWVGHVATRDPRVGSVNRHIHELATEVAASRDWVQIEDLAAYLGSGEGIATTCLIEDGLHLSATCLDQAAEQLVADLPALDDRPAGERRRAVGPRRGRPGASARPAAELLPSRTAPLPSHRGGSRSGMMRA